MLAEWERVRVSNESPIEPGRTGHIAAFNERKTQALVLFGPEDSRWIPLEFLEGADDKKTITTSVDHKEVLEKLITAQTSAIAHNVLEPLLQVAEELLALGCDVAVKSHAIVWRKQNE